MWRQVEGPDIRVLWDLRDARFDLSVDEVVDLGEFIKRHSPVLRGKSICVTGEVFEMPTLAERSLSLAISGAEVCSESAKHKAGGPRMHRGPFASVWIVALVGDGPRVLLQAASR